jgi:CRP/FNR family transcriptional regulator, cyclic AMP receptor protein
MTDEFLDSLTAGATAYLFERGHRKAWRRGDLMFAEGERAERVVVLLDGRVKVTSLSGDGRLALLAFRRPTCLVGELSAVDGLPCSATVTTLEPARGLLVQAPDFRSFLTGFPDARARVMQTLSTRLRDADSKRREFATMDTRGRVAGRLLELVDEFGVSTDGRIRIDLPLTQDDLAAWTGSSREAVTKALRVFRDRGVIDTRRRAIVVNDLNALRKHN